MSTFGTGNGSLTRPHAVVVLPSSAFADEWPHKPHADVAIGLRLLSEQDIKIAKGQAKAALLRAQTGHKVDVPVLSWELYNDELMRYAMARATTDCNDIAKTYFQHAEDTIQVALTSRGVARLWDAYTKMLVATSPASPQATDDDVVRLSRILAQPGVLDRLESGKRAEARKVLAYVLENFSPDDGAEEDDDEGYTAVAAADDQATAG
jgi:hypothetical protein